MVRYIRCYICDGRFLLQTTVRFNGEDRQDICRKAIGRRENFERPPLEVSERTRLCHNCYQSIVEEIRLELENPLAVRLNILRQTRNGSCVICDAEDNLHRLSAEAKADVFLKCGIFMPEIVRSCQIHLDNRGFLLFVLLGGLQHVNRTCTIRGTYLSTFLQGIRDVNNRVRFCEEDDFTDEEFHTFTSLTKPQFQNLFAHCENVPIPQESRRVSKRELLMFLCKMRQGLSDEFLKALFEYDSRQAVSTVIAKVRKSLMQRFVTENIGLNHINRDEYIRRHVTDFSNQLINAEPENKKAIVIIDGTYTYSHKSMNFRALRQSYCLHKGRHLIKPALLVAPDGYILDIHGPYFSDAQNNDASMLRNEFENEQGLLHDWFQEDDYFIFDRGYRDIIPYLEEHGLRHKMPALLDFGERQLSTDDANESRVVTKLRWLVEARNGHIKSIFKFLSNVSQIQHLPNIGDFYRIAGALVNKYHPPILMENADVAYANRMLARARIQNAVQRRVETENLAARDAQRWVRLDEENLNDFPILNEEYLRNLTYGVYQVHLAPSYVQDKLQREGHEEFQIEMLADHDRLPIPGLLRVRVYSRYRNATMHQLWISYNPIIDGEDQNRDPIRGYYCLCKSGARTLGTCAHVTSVLWYLGYARHEEEISYPSQLLLDAIMDAGNRGPQINPA